MSRSLLSGDQRRAYGVIVTCSDGTAQRTMEADSTRDACARVRRLGPAWRIICLDDAR